LPIAVFKTLKPIINKYVNPLTTKIDISTCIDYERWKIAGKNFSLRNGQNDPNNKLNIS